MGLLPMALVTAAALGVGAVSPAAASEEASAVDSDRVSLAAPGGFSDISDTSVHRPNVEILESTECTPGKFCPSQPIQRWVMAVWLVRAVDGVNPDMVESSRFVDVEAEEWWSPYVERLANLGITLGCSIQPTQFCPSEAVTRAQMASFLARAFHLPQWAIPMEEYLERSSYGKLDLEFVPFHRWQNSEHNSSSDIRTGIGGKTEFQYQPSMRNP